MESIDASRIDGFLKDFTLSDKNADPTNWKWDNTEWIRANEDWQNFHKKWFGDPENQSDTLTNPDTASPSLSLEYFPVDTVEFDMPSIFIRKSYFTMFDIVWAQSVRWRGGKGIIISGQPGIGKSIFNVYLLVRLLLLKQVVLFSPNGDDMYLFYHDGVYEPRLGLSIQTSIPLPEPVSSSNVFIWSLFDILEEKQPAHNLVKRQCFPVQTAYRNSARYYLWRKQWSPLFTGLPLWTREELAQGLLHHGCYPDLWKALNKVYESSFSNAAGPLYRFEGLRELLEDVHDEEDTCPLSPQELLDHALNAVIQRFGYSARDVFNAIFSYPAVTALHQEAFRINYKALEKAIYSLCSDERTGYPISIWIDSILTISPVYDPDALWPVTWDVDFKSDWIARNLIVNLVRKAESEDVVDDLIEICRNTPGVRGMAGRLSAMASTPGNFSVVE